MVGSTSTGALSADGPGGFGRAGLGTGAVGLGRAGWGLARPAWAGPGSR
ncbi:Protein of unknown function [Micromonospora lupini str. Lupac 08]|uniref:Uncharacterized protein n=1 Tax=Micromonospora lupini str. Lupac 08 TaxID=1150864 RepID=I0KWG4_9ACTN|nr:Protein of unknown function [Micromonospora lupini str. Lupac 08]